MVCLCDISMLMHYNGLVVCIDANAIQWFVCVVCLCDISMLMQYNGLFVWFVCVIYRC